MRSEKTSDVMRTRARDPKPGTILAAAAGGFIEAEFPFFNDSPDVAGFYIGVSGLSADWLVGTGIANEEMAAASGGGSLTLKLTPPITAAVGDYDFNVWIESMGAPVSAQTPLVLRVEPGKEVTPTPPPTITTDDGAAKKSRPIRRPETKSVDTRPVQYAVTPPPPIVKPDPMRPSVPESDPEPLRSFVEEPPKPVTPVLSEPVVVTPPVTPVEPPPPIRTVQESAPPPPVRPAEPPPVRPVLESEPPSKPVDLTPPPQKPVTPPPSRPLPDRPYEPEPVLVDMQTRTNEYREYEDDLPEEHEPSVLEPQDGAMLTLRPGETLLIRFAFTNEGQRERTYILDEDGSLEPGWITLVKDQVNLTRNGRGEVSLRLKPPLDARPGEYPFAVTVGPQGDVLSSKVLTLLVAATPAVKLVATQTQVKIGAFGTFADFPLSVESVGNADTAFRIAVKAPPVKQGDEARNSRGAETMYETAQWRYLFDRELDTLKSAGAGRPPRPVNIRLRLQRRGPWWLGLQESHSVSVTAVPVTDSTNGGKTENVVDLVATRKRFLPFPAPFALLIFVPLLLMLVVKASFLGVTNAYVANSVYYVLGAPASNVPLVAKLRWDAPFFAFVNVSATQNGETTTHWFRHGGDEDKVGDVGYGLEKTYEVTRRKITVRFVPIKTDHKLQITSGDLDYAHRQDVPLPALQQGLEKIGEDNVQVQSSTYLLNVPRGKNVPLNFSNTTPRSSSANIQYWVVDRPDPSFFAVLDSKDNDQISPMTASAPLKIRVTGASPSDTQELTLVTTDGGNQIVHVKLRAQ